MASSHRRFRSLPGFDEKTSLGSQTLVVERSKRDWYFYFKLVSRFNVFVQSKHTSVNRFSI